MIKVSVSSRSKESKRIPQKCVQQICSLLWIRVANVAQLYVFLSTKDTSIYWFKHCTVANMML